MMGISTRVLLLALAAAVLAVQTNASKTPIRGAPKRQLRFTWSPPTPQLTSLPCPRTAVPTAATSKTLWVDPSYSGTVAIGNASHPFKTMAAAWAALPKAPAKLTAGVTINFKPGIAFQTSAWPISLSLAAVWGTADAPVIIQRDPAAAADSAGSFIDVADISNCSYLFFKGINFQARPGSPAGNVVRISSSDYIYLLNVTIAGAGNGTGYGGTAQTLKVSNARGIYVEDSDIGGAPAVGWALQASAVQYGHMNHPFVSNARGIYVEDSDIGGASAGGWALQYSAVQYGHICRSRVHHSDWCLGLSGGSAYFVVDSNIVHNCGQAGLVSGLGGGQMNSPWLQYDAYSIKVTNNVIRDVWGAGLSVFGGYSILLAHNTLHKVGSRSHTVEIKTSSRGCGWGNATCAAVNAMGGWVPPVSPSAALAVPSRDVMFVNNLIVNPNNASAMWAHFSTSSPIATTAAYPVSMPNPISVSQGLVIKGNLFVNWKPDPKYAMGLGLDACAKTGLQCNTPTVLAENHFNVPGLAITFSDPDSLTLTEDSKAALGLVPYKPAAEAAFAAWDTPLATPQGQLANAVPVDRLGTARVASNDLPGAYYDAAYTPTKFCFSPPAASLAPNSTNGWSASCTKSAVGSSCTAPCGSRATGTDYTARCDDTDMWTILTGSCATKVCSGLPDATAAPYSAGFSQSCAGSLIGSLCSAPCAAGATGFAYTARCDDTDTWTVLNGSCGGLQLPPLPSYPCRTEVPTALASKTLWVDPAYTGTVAIGNATHPFKTFAAAWATLPKAPQWLTAGVTINLKPGIALAGSMTLSGVQGTPLAPLIIQRDPAADSSLQPSVLEVIFMTNCSYVYFNGVTFQPKTTAAANAVRIANSDSIYLLGVTVAGIYNTGYPGTAQALKVHNSRGIYIEDSEVYGSSAGGFALNIIAVQYGHVARSKVHHADWCFGLSGGTAYFIVDGNTVHTCGQAALVSGGATDPFQMNSPWQQYSAYGITVTNNVIRDVWGAGLSVFGGYSILLAHNTLHRVGSRSHTIEIQFSSRGCSGTAAACAALSAQGGWLPSAPGASISIPSRDVQVLNNIIVNPKNESAKWAHFATSASVNTTGLAAYPPSIPNPVTMYQGLVVKGNVFVNWHSVYPYMNLGLDPCYNTGLPCDKPTVLADNLINVPGLSLTFTDPESLVLSDDSKAALGLVPYKPAAEAAFAAWDTPLATPPGQLANAVLFDKNGVARSPAIDLPGAYCDPDHKPPKICSIPPDAAWGANSTAGWPKECGRAVVGAVCTAPCGSRATGSDYTARCEDSDTWTFLGGSCATKTCAAPPSAYLAPNSIGFDANCVNTLVGSSCAAPCSANATGSTWVARCDDTNTWSIVNGSCEGPQRQWNPATPPLPSYPCPRTQVPYNLAPRTIWVDPAYTGAVAVGNASHPFKTFAAAWFSLGKGLLKAGVVMNIKPGVALSGRLWMDGVWGTEDAPLIIQRDPAADASAPPSIIEIVDIFNCTYMYFKGITFQQRLETAGGNVVHLASCSYVYLLNVTIAGYGTGTGYPGSNQALKINQVKGLYVEDSDIFGSCPNGVGLDGVAVQYGHVCRSNIHHADWCMYIKGGSAYFIIDSNTVHHCQQAGLRVGQGTGFEFMTPPFLEYEAYGMKMTNNVIYNVWGAGLGAIGSYSVLIAHNTLYKVGSRSHTVEFYYGTRGCGSNAVCTRNWNLGGWGPALATSPAISIPSKDVQFLNNIIVNPKNESSMWSHFSVSSNLNTTGSSYPPSMPNPLSVTQGFVIKGNVFVNPHRSYPSMSLGLAACEKTGLPCDPTTVLVDNLINVPGLNLTFTDPESLVLTDDSKAALRAANYKHAAEVPFASWTTGVETPPGVLDNTLPIDRDGSSRDGGSDLPGARV
ncbi:hypothetical protein OEZ85_003855 [Tetradesmus obliquus]|uniref:Right handed beta helix domain-containing protein n=1 Tax=Tetradesmus obliquus TaxID=3088 RepID=A0ABY8UCM1_TETOB|nr:hypothetical protein OEZ85_003855 [Tetradesmus obliquus]